MDKTKSYITMCQAAEEIQKVWEQEYGDFFVQDNGRVACWLTTTHETLTIKKGGRGYKANGNVIYMRRFVWLPRLDQLMDIARPPPERFEKVIQNFYDWTTRLYYKNPLKPAKLFDTVEQHWLAFAMQTRFQKYWRESEWFLMK